MDTFHCRILLHIVLIQFASCGFWIVQLDCWFACVKDSSSVDNVASPEWIATMVNYRKICEKCGRRRKDHSIPFGSQCKLVPLSPEEAQKVLSEVEREEQIESGKTGEGSGDTSDIVPVGEPASASGSAPRTTDCVANPPPPTVSECNHG